MEKESLQTTQEQLKTYRDDEKQINSLLKAIRPKVYITDSSSFKSLVQQLTGNEGHHLISLPPPTQELHDHVPVISTGEHEEAEACRFGGKSCGEMMQFPVDLDDFGIPMLPPLAGFTTVDGAWMAEEVGEFQHQEVGAWPVEGDPLPFYDGCYSFQRLVEREPFLVYDGYSVQKEEEMLCSQ